MHKYCIKDNISKTTDQILVGHSVYDTFTSDGIFRNKFTNVKLPYDKWNYIDKSSGNIYELYSYD